MLHRFTCSAIVATLTVAGCASLPLPQDPVQEVRSAHEQLRLAFNDCNEARFIEAYAEPFSLTTSNTGAAIATTDGLRRYLGYGCRQSPSPQVTTLNESVRFSGGIAILTGQYLFRITNAGRVSEIKQNYTLVMQPGVRGWRTSAHHVSLLPQ